jgi:cytochrome c2
VSGRGAALVTALALGALLVPATAPADARRGERLFQRCHACHSVIAGEQGLPGPHLRGVVGRRAGTLPGFRFSPAMVQAGAAGLVWTRAALDAYLADPGAVVPGTEMTAPGLADPDDRREVIDYLERAPRGSPGAGAGGEPARRYTRPSRPSPPAAANSQTGLMRVPSTTAATAALMP